MSRMAEADLMGEMKQIEARLTLKREDDSQKKIQTNRFDEEAQENPELYQQKIEQLKKVESEKAAQTEYETFREFIVPTWESRKPLYTNKDRENAQEKYERRLKDSFEPISKERNRQLLEKLSEKMKDYDSQVEDQTFEQRFGDYVDRYKLFMGDMYDYGENRAYQCELLEETDHLVKCTKSNLVSLRYLYTRTTQNI